MGRLVDIPIGTQFGKLTVLAYANRSDRWGGALWTCQCDCENKTIKNVLSASLRSGKTTSCGCQMGLKNGKNPRYNHGQAAIKTRTSEYQAWQHTKTRCLNTKNKDYRDYGGRGIRVCKRWQTKNGFQNFLADLGPKPEPKRLYSLDRKNNNGNYTPSNCRWATHTEQANNRRPRRCPHCGKILYPGDLKK